MKDFAKARGRLRPLAFHARLAYSIFLAFTLVGFGMTAWLFSDMVGMDLEEVDEYYAGTPGEPLNEPAFDDMAAGTGPMLDLPEEAALAPAATPMSQRKLLEVTHFHLFTMPVYLLILAHLFMLSRVGNAFKGWVIAAASVGTVAHIAAPWAATSGSAASVILYGGSGSVMTVSYLIMCVLPLWEMWTPAPSASRPEVAKASPSFVTASPKAGSAVG